MSVSPLGSAGESESGVRGGADLGGAGHRGLRTERDAFTGSKAGEGNCVYSKLDASSEDCLIRSQLNDPPPPSTPPPAQQTIPPDLISDWLPAAYIHPS